MGNGKSAVLRPVEQPSWKGGSQSEGRQGGHDPETKMRSLLDLPEKCGVCKGAWMASCLMAGLAAGKESRVLRRVISATTKPISRTVARS